VKSFFWRWQRRLPSPLTRDDLRAGYVYDLAFRQFEISDTRVFDRPAAGRGFLSSSSATTSTSGGRGRCRWSLIGGSPAGRRAGSARR
jgi:hypothetical protein